jgi:hypothetical protein
VENGMNKDVNRPMAGLIIYQNAAQTDRSFWFIVRPDLIRKVSEICEKTLTVPDYTDEDVWKAVWNLLYNYDKNEYSEDILHQGFTDVWGWYSDRDIPLNKYEIIGIIPIKQVF